MRNLNLIATKSECSRHWSQRRQHFLNDKWKGRVWNLDLRLNFPSVLLVPSHFYGVNLIFLDRRSITFGKSYELSHQVPLGCVRHELTSEEPSSGPAKNYRHRHRGG